MSSGMGTKSAVFWLLPGFAISIIDIFLSIQSMVGILQAKTVIGYLAAVVVGTSLTLFAITSPVWGRTISSANLQAVRYLLLGIDIGTSVVGAIWYGLMRQPITSKIHLEKMHFDPSNTLATAGFIAFVLIVAWVCHQFGRAMATLVDASN